MFVLGILFGCSWVVLCSFSLALLIISSTVSIFRSLCMVVFLSNHGAFAIVRTILFWRPCSFFKWMREAFPHVVELYVIIGCRYILYTRVLFFNDIFSFDARMGYSLLYLPSAIFLLLFNVFIPRKPIVACKP